MIRSYLVAACLCLLAACSDPSAPPVPDATIDPFLGKSPDLQACSDLPAGASYTLGNVAIEDHHLLVHVQTDSGCVGNAFRACWNGSVADTEPGTVDLAINFYPHDDTCDAPQPGDLRIDLAPILAKFRAPLAIEVTGTTRRIDGTKQTALLTN